VTDAFENPIPLTRPALRVMAFLLILSAVFVCAYLAGANLQAFTTNTFADARELAGVANFENVFSNLAFLIVGVFGLRTLSGLRAVPAAWRVFYAGLVLTCAGSAFYHLAPSDASILWDRLGMTVSFTGLAVALFEQCTGVRLGSVGLVAALVVAGASVIWWRLSGDLVPYAGVQATPLAFAALAILARWVPARLRRALEVSSLFYLLAKLAEMRDAEIYAATDHLVSGHTLKHLLAAVSAAAILAVHLKQRRDLVTARGVSC